VPSAPELTVEHEEHGTVSESSDDAAQFSKMLVNLPYNFFSGGSL
jgi:hypothetical protein